MVERTWMRMLAEAAGVVPVAIDTLRRQQDGNGDELREGNECGETN